MDEGQMKGNVFFLLNKIPRGKIITGR